MAYITRGYTDNGRPATFADANPGVTSYTYDAFDRMVRTSFPASGTGSTNAGDYEALTLDVAGNVTARRTRSALSITMTYDRLNRMKTRVVPASGSIPARTATYAYDLAGRQDVVTETGGHNLDWSYDAMGRASSVAISGPQWSGAKTISYQYDAASNRTRLTWPDGYSVAYVYDDLNRLDTATQTVGGVSTLLADYSYDPQSRRTGAALDVAGAGGSITLAFTVGSDLTSIAHGWTGPSGVTVTYSYDRGHRLADETFSDSAWRWAPATGVTDGYTPDYLNRYSAARGATLSYDANQNLTGDGSWTWTYDPENRLVSAAGPSSQTAAYSYDPLGRRVKKVATGPVAVTEGYLLDGDEEIAEYDGSGNLVRRFVPSNATDMPIVQVTAAGVRTYFRVNRQGTVMAMTGTSGALAEGPFEYDPYGAPAGGDVSTAGTPFRYTGRRYDPETGLYYYRARYYSSGLGRFMQTDPIGYEGGVNLYVYVGNSPPNGADPSGTEPHGFVNNYDPHYNAANRPYDGSSRPTYEPRYETTYAGGEVSAVIGVGGAAGTGTYETRTYPGNEFVEAGVYMKGTIALGGDLDVGVSAERELSRDKPENGTQLTFSASGGPVNGSVSGGSSSTGIEAGLVPIPASVTAGYETRGYVPVQTAPAPKPPPARSNRPEVRNNSPIPNRNGPNRSERPKP